MWLIENRGRWLSETNDLVIMFKFAWLKWIESDFFKQFKFVWFDSVTCSLNSRLPDWGEWSLILEHVLILIGFESSPTNHVWLWLFDASCALWTLVFPQMKRLDFDLLKKLNLIEFCGILIKLKSDWLRLVASESSLSLVDWNELSLIDEKQLCAIQVWKESSFATGDEVMSSVMIERSDGVYMRSKGSDSKRNGTGDGSNVKAGLFNASGVPRLKGVNGLLRCNSCRERRFS
jgi:hypothetical protein